MGGRYDASNVVERPLGTIIAPVDYDHQNFLGNSLTEIAGEKAGILKAGARGLIARQPEEAMQAIEAAKDLLTDGGDVQRAGGIDEPLERARTACIVDPARRSVWP